MKFSFIQTFTLSLCLFTIFYSCTPPEKTQYPTGNSTVIKINTKDSLIHSFSEVIASSAFIKLQTGKDYLIGNVDKILFEDGKIFIVDKYIAEAVLVFKEDGSFLYKIANKGKAPGEYLEIRDLIVDKAQQELLMLDLKGRKINHYTYDGKFKSTAPLPFLFSDFSQIESNQFAFSTATANNSQNKEVNNKFLVIGNLNGNVTKTLFPVSKSDENFSFFNEHPLKCFGKDLFYYPRFRNTIYKITPSGADPVYTLDFQDNGIPEDEIDNLNNESFIKLTKTHSYFNGGHVELKNHACFTVNTPKGPCNLFYSKRTKKTIFSINYIIKDPLESFIQMPVASYKENSIVTIAKSTQILGLKPLLDNQLDSRVTELYRNFEEHSNPVIFFYTLKD